MSPKTTKPYLSKAPKAITNPDQFRIGFEDYYDETKLNPFEITDYVGKDGISVTRQKERPLTLEGFENFMCDRFGIATIQQYVENRDGRYSEYVSILSYVRRRIRQEQIEGGMAGMYHPNLTARINAISDKMEQTVEQSVKLLNIDPL